MSTQRILSRKVNTPFMSSGNGVFTVNTAKKKKKSLT